MPCAEFGAEHFNGNGQHGHENNPDDHFAEIVFHYGQVAEAVAQIGQQYNPQQAADDVVADKAAVVHFAHAGNERGKRAHNRHEPRQNNGFAAVFVVKRVGFGQIFLLEDFAVRIGKQFFAEEFADGEVECVAQNRRRQQHQHDDVDIQITGGRCGHRAGGKQQRIAWQHRGDHQPGFAKDDKEQNDIQPRAVFCGERDQVFVDVQDEIDNLHKHDVQAAF